jgi:hypothetical protein
MPLLARGYPLDAEVPGGPLRLVVTADPIEAKESLMASPKAR